MHWISCFVYGLFVIWTGLLRGIEAAAYKPNSLWFCLAMGLGSLAACYLYRMNLRFFATALATFCAGLVLAFYFYCFVGQPEKDASVRVGLVIVFSIGQLAILYMPNFKAEES